MTVWQIAGQLKSPLLFNGDHLEVLKNNTCPKTVFSVSRCEAPKMIKVEGVDFSLAMTYNFLLIKRESCFNQGPD